MGRNRPMASRTMIAPFEFSLARSRLGTIARTLTDGMAAVRQSPGAIQSVAGPPDPGAGQPYAQSGPRETVSRFLAMNLYTGRQSAIQPANYHWASAGVKEVAFLRYGRPCGPPPQNELRKISICRLVLRSGAWRRVSKDGNDSTPSLAADGRSASVHSELNILMTEDTETTEFLFSDLHSTREAS